MKRTPLALCDVKETLSIINKAYVTLRMTTKDGMRHLTRIDLLWSTEEE